MGCLSNEEFFSRLAELFSAQKGKEHGAIYLSQRRLAKEEIATAAGAQPVSETALIIRASNGKSKLHRKEKVRLSTMVNADALEAFYARYAEACKSGMTALKPRDKSKKKAKAKKKKASTTTTTL